MTEALGPVLVTGATGMVGSALCARLVAAATPVVALVLDDDPRSALRRSGTAADLTVVSGDLEDLRALERAVVVHDVRTIVHLGAQTLVGAARRDPLGTFRTNVAGTWNILEVARRQRDLVTGVVVASSDKAYGATDDLPYVEDHPMGGIQPYEASKSCADIVARSYAATYDLPVTVARCGNIYGPGDLNWSRIVPGTIRSLLRGETPVIRSDGTLVRDYIHVDDVVDAYLALAGSPAPAGRAYNFSDGEPRSVLDVYEAVCRAVVGGPVEPDVWGEASDEIPAQHLDATRARTELGWSASVTLDRGLAETADWYRALLGTGPPSATVAS